MNKEIVVTQTVYDTEIVGKNLPIVKVEKSKKNTNPTGIDIRTNADGSKTYYILIKHEGKLIREKVGKDRDGITIQYAKNIRADRVAKLLHGEISPNEIKKAKRKNARSLDSVAQEYLKEIEDLSDGKTTKGRYNNHLKAVFGNMNMDEITPEMIESFKQKKLKEVSFKTGRTYSNKSVNDFINLLNTIFKYGINQYNLPIVSPARGKSKKNRGSGGVERLSEDNARERYLDEDEIQMLYTALDNREGKDHVNFELKLLVRLALCTGARLTSLLNIQKKDISLKQGSVTIKDYKNDSTYTAFLSDKATELLNEYMPTLKATDYVIGGGKEPKHRSSINKSLQPLLDELFNEGLDANDAKNRVVIHTLRHTFGSLLAINGTPIFTIKKLMNHKSIEMTMRYAKLAPDQGRDNVRGLNI